MTDLLIKLFVKNSDDVENTQVRGAYGKMAGIVGIVCNSLLALLKFIAGLVSGSISIMADAINNLSDMAASVITLVGFKVASKPADKEHPFGHARFEYLSGLAVSVLVAAIGINLAASSVEKIITPVDVDFNTLSLLILAFSIIVKLWMAVFNRKLGRLINSDTLAATFADSRNDCITTGAVLAAALIARFTGFNTDAYMGLAVAVFIVLSGLGLIKETLNPILGEAPNEELVEYVQNKIMTYEGVLGTHDLIVHDYGPGRRFASAHVEMSSESDVLKSHDIIDNIERDFLKYDNLNLIIHYDPIVTGDAAINTAREKVRIAVEEVDIVLSIHDFRMVDGPSHTNYIFDVVVPLEFPLEEEELRKKLEEKLQNGIKPVHVVMTVDESYSPIP